MNQNFLIQDTDMMKSSHDSSEEADESQASPDQLRQLDDDA